MFTVMVVFFTWLSKRIDGFLTKKLDRVMVNIHWVDAFSDIHSTFLLPESSDHSAGLLRSQCILAPKKGSFKFFNFLTRNSTFHAVVHEIWSSTSVCGVKMYQLCCRVKALKPSLKSLSKENYQDIH